MKASKSKMAAEFKVEIAKQSQHAMPEMHYHDFYEIYIQDQGTRDHIVSNTFYKLNAHDVMLLKPTILHQSISLEPHTRTIVYFTDVFLKLPSSDTEIHSVNRMEHSPRCFKIFFQIMYFQQFGHTLLLSTLFCRRSRILCRLRFSSLLIQQASDDMSR